MNPPLPTRFTFSTLGCPERNLDEVLDLAARFGLNQIELRALEDRLDLPVYLEEKYGSPEKLAALLDERQIRIVTLDTSLSLQKTGEQDREAFLRFLPWAEALNVPTLRVFDGGKFHEPFTEEELATAVDQVAWWREQKTRHGWRTDIVIETHDLCCSSRNIQQLQAALPYPIPILWDTWHVWFKNHEPIADTWAAIGQWVRHIHFKDGIREPILHFPYHYQIPGQGVFPLRELFALLERDEYRGAISLEWERKWHPYLPPIEEALEGVATLQTAD